MYAICVYVYIYIHIYIYICMCVYVCVCMCVYMSQLWIPQLKLLMDKLKGQTAADESTYFI